MLDKEIEEAIESLIQKGYLNKNKNGEIGITLKGQRIGMKLTKLFDYN